MRVVTAIVLFVMSSPAFAALGEPEKSCLHDQKVLGSSRVVLSESDTVVHEMRVGGNVIREYINSNGIVFAITWRGVSQPDLSLLLGRHYSEYKPLAQRGSVKPGRAPSKIKTSRAVVVMSGHMRAVHGAAYVPSLVPAGVNAETLP